MQYRELVREHLRRAAVRLRALDVLYDGQSWPDVVRESQEVVELTLKALLRASGIEPPRVHDVSPLLIAQRARLPATLHVHVPELAMISRELRRDRELAFYGSEDLSPSSFYTEADARRAKGQAVHVVDLVTRNVIESVDGQRSPLVHVRPASPTDASAIARVHVASWRTTYKDLLPADLLANLSVEGRTRQWDQQIGDATTFVCVAEDDAGQVVGFASAGPEREPESGYDAELYAIYLLAEHQGSGAGRELARLVIDELRARGDASLRVWVLAGNPAEGFYQRLGGVKVEEKPIDIGGTEYIEIAYGWRSLDDVDLRGN